MDEIVKEFTEIQAETIEKTITAADTYGMDRGDALKMMVDVLFLAIDMGDYSEYQTKVQKEETDGQSTIR